jgi:polyphenol oxidase
LTPAERVQPSIFSSWPEVTAAMSTRQGSEGESPFGMNLSFNVGDVPDRVERNRRAFFGSLGIELKELAIPGQVHSAQVQLVHEPGLYKACDALVTRTPRVFLCVTVADCLPILMFDPEHLAVAGVHAGWRGTAAEIVRSAVQTMQDHFRTDPRQLVVFIGPGAGSCCYEIGDEVADRIDAQFVVHRGSSSFADLKAANSAQLQSSGVLASNIEVHPSCTISEADRFHSYRRDRDRSGRMMAVVGLSAPIR